MNCPRVEPRDIDYFKFKEALEDLRGWSKFFHSWSPKQIEDHNLENITADLKFYEDKLKEIK